MLTSEKLDHSHLLLQFAMGYKDKLIAFRFGIKIQRNIMMTAMSKQKYTGARVFECKKSKSNL